MTEISSSNDEIANLNRTFKSVASLSIRRTVGSFKNGRKRKIFATSRLSHSEAVNVEEPQDPVDQMGEPNIKIHTSTVRSGPRHHSESVSYGENSKQTEFPMDVDKSFDCDTDVDMTEYEGDADSEDLARNYASAKKRLRKTAYIINKCDKDDKERDIPSPPPCLLEVRQSSYSKKLIYFITTDEEDTLLLPEDAKPVLAKLLNSHHSAKDQVAISRQGNHYVVKKV
uniref:Ras-associating domain-containing protein n=1 Tax=Rhabditophanes sp. KR3021 TaxID=114890 RepID=A0AC35TSQ2_9BILA